MGFYSSSTMEQCLYKRKCSIKESFFGEHVVSLALEGFNLTQDGDSFQVRIDSVTNTDSIDAGGLLFMVRLYKNGHGYYIGEGVLCPTSLQAGDSLHDLTISCKIRKNIPSGVYEPRIEVEERCINPEGTSCIRSAGEFTADPSNIHWINPLEAIRNKIEKDREQEEARKKANAIVVKNGLAAQSYKPASIGFEGMGWRMADGKVTISADKIKNRSDWSAGALNLTLWYCEKPYQKGDGDSNKKYEMADGIVSPNALSGESGKNFFDHPKIISDIKADPPTGDYYALVVIYEKKVEGGWNWRTEASWNNPHHWNNRAEARKREEEDRKRVLNHREKTTYGLPPANVRQRLFDAIAEARQTAQENRPKAAPLDMNVLFNGIPLWSGDATDGFAFPIGVQEDGSPLVMEIGDANVHGLVGGMTGSGKSNLLHAIIHSLCWKYSPAELELHLLDYKDGMDFKVYSNENESAVWIPQTKTISTHNDPAYALSLFDELQREAMRRKKLFGSARNYREFRQKGGRLPRVFVLVDEFHKLFEGHERLVVEERIKQILKQGRAYGIHLLMSTQALRGIDVDRAALGGQISARLALRGNDDDGILDMDNDAAAHIECPMCVYNDKTGKPAGNHLFKVPFVDVSSEAESAFRAAIEKGAREGGFPCKGRVFRGTELPPPPLADNLFDEAPDTTGLVVRIGVRDDYLAGPAFVVLDDAPNGHFLAAAPAGNDMLDDAGNLTCNGVWDGLFASVATSLAATPDTAVVLYDPLARAKPASLPDEWTFLGSGAGEGQLLDTLKTLAEAPAEHRVLVVLNWAKAVRLHPHGDSGGSYLDEPTEETARAVFSSAFSSTSDRVPFHAMLFVRNFTYAKRETFGDFGALLKGCSQRVAVNLSGDDLGELFPSMDTQGSSHRIFVGSTDSDEVSRFLPFRAET